MTEIIKCSECKQKLDKEFAIIEVDPENSEVNIYTHPGCAKDNIEQVTCELCDKKFKMITPGHLTKHNIEVREYKLRYGPVVSESQKQRLTNQSRVTRGGSDVLLTQNRELRTQLDGALQTIENHSTRIEELTEEVNDRPTTTDHDNTVGGVEYVNTGPRTIGVVFTMEEIENIGAVALREMVKLKFGHHESRKADNVEKLRSLVE